MAARDGTEVFLNRHTRVRKIQQITAFLAQMEGRDLQVKQSLSGRGWGGRGIWLLEQGKGSTLWKHLACFRRWGGLGHAVNLDYHKDC